MIRALLSRLEVWRGNRDVHTRTSYFQDSPTLRYYVVYSICQHIGVSVGGHDPRARTHASFAAEPSMAHCKFLISVLLLLCLSKPRCVVFIWRRSPPPAGVALSYIPLQAQGRTSRHVRTYFNGSACCSLQHTAECTSQPFLHNIRNVLAFCPHILRANHPHDLRDSSRVRKTGV